MPQAGHVVSGTHQAQARLEQDAAVVTEGGAADLVVDPQPHRGLELAPVDRRVGRVQEHPGHVLHVRDLVEPGEHLIVRGQVLAVGVTVAGKHRLAVLEGVKEHLAA